MVEGQVDHAMLPANVSSTFYVKFSVRNDVGLDISVKRKPTVMQAQAANASISASTRKRNNFDPCTYACACARAASENQA